MSYRGVVSFHNKPLKTPVSILLVNDHNRTPILTDSIGNFGLSDEQLITPPDKKISLLLDWRKKGGYYIQLTDPYMHADSVFTQAYTPKDYNSDHGTTTFAQLTDNKRAIKLSTVLINNDASGIEIHTKNECGDYVCRNDILNCANHADEPDNKPAIKGRYYKTQSSGASRYIYNGCIGQSYYFNEPQFSGI